MYRCKYGMCVKSKLDKGIVDMINLQSVFEQMSNDVEIVETYSRIAVKEADEGYATHDMSHVNRVIDNCVEISRLLGVDDNDISAIKIAALLHDIGCLDGRKKEHDKRSAEWAKKYLSKKTYPNVS